MTKTIYTLESAKRIIKTAVTLLDRTFPGQGVRVGVYQGERPFIDPWRLEVRSDDPDVPILGYVEVELNIRSILDDVDNGGGRTHNDYAVGIFDGILAQIAAQQTDPGAFMTAARMRLAESLPQVMGEVGSDGTTAGESGIVLPPGTAVN